MAIRFCNYARSMLH